MSRTKICFKPNSISYDFPYPIKYENITEKSNISSKRNHELGNRLLHQYNNELPEFFRLKGMIKNNKIYNNPHLDEIPIVDLKENYKKLENTKKIIKLIDRIKSSRKLSQDPKILGKIVNEKELIYKKMYKPKMRNEINKNYTNYSTTDIKPKMTLSIDEKNVHKVLNLYRNVLINPNNVRKLGHKFKKQINENALIYLDKEKKIKCSKYDINKLNKLESVIDIGHSSYIADINNYDIKENTKEKDRCIFEFERKPIKMYDPILQENKIYNLPNLKINKWDQYSEAFTMMDNKLYKKGGLFSEFIKMNKLGFKMMDKDRKEKMQKFKIISPRKKIPKRWNHHSRNCFSDANIKNSFPKIKKYKIINGSVS